MDFFNGTFPRHESLGMLLQHGPVGISKSTPQPEQALESAHQSRMKVSPGKETLKPKNPDSQSRSSTFCPKHPRKTRKLYRTVHKTWGFRVQGFRVQA